MKADFTFKLTTQKIYPAVRIKHMSQRAASISFAATMQQLDSRGQRKRELPTPIRRGHFIDVKTLAGALFARGFSLASLSQFLKVDNPKLDFDDFDGPITDDMARYAVRDVQATWECYREVMTRIARLAALVFNLQRRPTLPRSGETVRLPVVDDAGNGLWRAHCRPVERTAQ